MSFFVVYSIVFFRKTVFPLVDRSIPRAFTLINTNLMTVLRITLETRDHYSSLKTLDMYISKILLKGKIIEFKPIVLNQIFINPFCTSSEIFIINVIFDSRLLIDI